MRKDIVEVLRYMRNNVDQNREAADVIESARSLIAWIDAKCASGEADTISEVREGIGHWQRAWHVPGAPVLEKGTHDAH